MYPLDVLILASHVAELWLEIRLNECALAFLSIQGLQLLEKLVLAAYQPNGHCYRPW